MKFKADDKPVSVTANIEPGEVAPAVRIYWTRFWSKVICSVTDDTRGGQLQSQKSEDRKVTDENL